MGHRRQSRAVAGSVSAGDAFERVIAALERRGHRVRRQGHNRATTTCTHDGADNPAALSVFDNGSRVVFWCFTRECRSDEIADSLGLTWKDMYDEPTGDDLATYRYDDGRTVHRKASKQFRQTGHKGPPTLYHASRIQEAITKGRVVYVVEGEEDVHSLEAIGHTATTAPMGARNFDKVDVSPLVGAHVVAIPDGDDEGSRWAELVAEKLAGVAASLRFARPAHGKDASDHIAAGLGAADFAIEDPDADRRAGVLRKYPALDLARILDPNRPAREYVVAGLIPAGASVSLAAPAGTGKSLLALALALAVARGRHAFAGLTIQRPRRVLYVDMENTEDDLAERFESFGVRRGDTLGALTYLSLPSLPPLDTRQGGEELMGILDAYQLERNDFVILDSLQRVTEGEENASDTMRAFYLHTGIKLKRAGLTTLRLDNTGKDVTRGSRGTSGKRDDVDIELVMVPDEEDDERFRITLNKTRLSDVAPLILTRFVDRSGETKFHTDDDPNRTAINAAKTELDRQHVPINPDMRQAREALSLRNFTERTIRAAVRERRATWVQPLTCAGCGHPMTSLGDGATTHPGCEER